VSAEIISCRSGTNPAVLIPQTMDLLAAEDHEPGLRQSRVIML